MHTQRAVNRLTFDAPEIDSIDHLCWSGAGADLIGAFSLPSPQVARLLDLDDEWKTDQFDTTSLTK